MGYEWVEFKAEISVKRPMADVLESATGRRVSRYTWYSSDFADSIQTAADKMRRNMEARLF